jgi:hypothetical protein
VDRRDAQRQALPEDPLESLRDDRLGIVGVDALEEDVGRGLAHEPGERAGVGLAVEASERRIRGRGVEPAGGERRAVGQTEVSVGPEKEHRARVAGGVQLGEGRIPAAAALVVAVADEPAIPRALSRRALDRREQTLPRINARRRQIVPGELAHGVAVGVTVGVDDPGDDRPAPEPHHGRVGTDQAVELRVGADRDDAAITCGEGSDEAVRRVQRRDLRLAQDEVRVQPGHACHNTRPA